MVRLFRFELEGVFYRITSHGNDRGKIFFEHKDYDKRKDCLKGICENFGIVIYDYVLMINYYHLLIEK